MTVDQTPGSVDQYGVPRVLPDLSMELHPRSVLGALSVATHRLAVQTGVAVSNSNKNLGRCRGTARRATNMKYHTRKGLQQGNDLQGLSRSSQLLLLDLSLIHISEPTRPY